MYFRYLIICFVIRKIIIRCLLISVKHLDSISSCRLPSVRLTLTIFSPHLLHSNYSSPGGRQVCIFIMHECGAKSDYSSQKVD